MVAGDDAGPVQCADEGTIAVVKRYKQHFEEQNPQASFNPYTVMRHCLFLHDRSIFRPALRNSAREAFSAWLTEQGEPKAPAAG